jgi:hypothetical protein
VVSFSEKELDKEGPATTQTGIPNHKSICLTTKKPAKELQTPIILLVTVDVVRIYF